MLKRFVKSTLITGGLETARIVKMAGLMKAARGRGAIFTLHHVRPRRPRLFDPNAHLEITPEFLDTAISTLKAEGYRFVALENLPQELTAEGRAPIAVFTLDDGYRNNIEHAAPVFSRYSVPFTVFATRGFIERTHGLWWETLADLMEAKNSLTFDFGAGPETLPLDTAARKHQAFGRFADYVGTGDEATAVAAIDVLARANGIEPLSITEKLTLDEGGLKQLVDNSLAQLGVHTVSHRALSRLSDEEVRAELNRSIEIIEQITGNRPTTLAYPYGFLSAVSARDRQLARALGLTVAVTTQPGTLDAAQELTALPRISLNGHFQKAAYVGALASGIPFRMMRTG
ncbi:peptidoglycan/xylan/chitin deacetylase (PgdA/CDA1 family) [Pararhizobium capsulatum DSM 1112]|uniref:Chitooligosaccharide deacetylase n=1 Tax=Pararhizobium capsulatum DSM 1112 TaxID=1121113 RepID=A0ABU0BP33_9HYPH|nr:polysaccharide deacetylase family protein [Pararhizobium capsulatum]MDQ0319431.1 peptidoglycan/xylan/chitin deacetylase (PgdA/CDA1 family) [Pararhizobium capsulatum DSM 1112]